MPQIATFEGVAGCDQPAAPSLHPACDAIFNANMN
jgi:hypothetical protein